MKEIVYIQDPQRSKTPIKCQKLATYNVNKPGAIEQIKADMLARVEARKKAKQAKEAQQ